MKILNCESYLEARFCLGVTPTFVNSVIETESENNLIVCEEGVKLNNCKITFIGTGNIVYLSKNKYLYNLDLRIYKNSVFYMDENNYMNGKLSVLVQEAQNVLIGQDGAFSYGIHIMTSDAHPIYDINTNERINYSKSVCIGDHIWLGSFCSLFKGTVIGSGSVIGGTATVSGKIVPSNTVWAGNPAYQIKKDILWKGECTNLYDSEKTKELRVCSGTDYIYKKNSCVETINLFDFDKQLLMMNDDINAKLDIIKKVRQVKDKYRFSIV